MNNLETYLTDIIKDAVREAVQEELEQLPYLPQKTESKNEPVPRERRDIFENTKLIRPKELAELLSVSIPTIYRMEKKGQLPQKYKISSHTVGWLNTEIEEWLMSNKI